MFTAPSVANRPLYSLVAVALRARIPSANIP
jgi:hypothetical protein